jgi:hypothetical protein
MLIENLVMFWSKGHNAYYLLGVLSVTFAPLTTYSTLLNTLTSNMLLESFLICNILFTYPLFHQFALHTMKFKSC